MNCRWKKNLYTLVALLFGLNVHADTLQSISSIEQAAYEYALEKAQERYDNPQLVIGGLDSRLRLQQCDRALNVFSQNNNNWLGNVTVGIKCNGPVAWTVYVPVKVKVFQPVYVTAHTIEANKVITQADLKLQRYDVGSLKRGYVIDSNKIVGKVLKYPAAMGTVIKSSQLQQQKVVRRGQSIMIIAMTGAMEVKMNGTALSDAGLGQRIKVKNTSSKRVIEGVVDAPGIVKVQL